MIVCICHRVSDRDIAHAVRAGCPSFDALQDELCVGTACGACQDCAHDSFHEQLRLIMPAGIAPVRSMAARAPVPTATMASALG